MPITPFHFGPAAVAKAGASKQFSFVAFGLTQVIVDIEPVFYISQGMWPIHRFFHTYLGATVVALVVILFGRPLCEGLLGLWNWRLSNTQRAWLRVSSHISITAMVTGALFGGYSHVFLDSIMHSDMHPFAPISEVNGLINIISIDRLHLLCVISAVLGGVVLSVLLIRRKMSVERVAPPA